MDNGMMGCVHSAVKNGPIFRKTQSTLATWWGKTNRL